MNTAAVNTAPASLLARAIAVVTDAGALVRAEFHRPGGPRGHGGKCPVDAEVELLLRDRLTALYPCAWHGEETGAAPIGGGDVWVVDPLDGTSDFQKGLRGAAISVALLRGGVPVLGIVFSPVAPDDAGDLVAWAEGGHLTRNGAVVTRAPAFGIIALNADAADYARQNHQALGGLRVFTVPSPAYRLALAAVGEVSVGLSLIGGLRPWDIAGGHALLRGAGLVLADLDGRSIDYRRNSFGGIIGGEADVVARVRAAPLRSGGRVPRHPSLPARPEADPGRLSRAQGALLGQLAGDALGSLVEFQSAAVIARRYPDGVTRLADGGTWDTLAGQPTDDSEMALALARSIVAAGGFEATAVGRAYIAWRQSGPFDIGGTTIAGIDALEGRGRPARESQSNGALMRVVPAGIAAAGDPARAARIGAADAALTHPHPVCVASSAAFAAAVATAIGGAGAEGAWTAAMDHAGDGDGAEAVRDRLRAARHAPPAEFQHQMGWVLTALQNAFFRLLSGAALDQALSDTVACGGDTDTNAAIAGALLGAVQGRDAIPHQWRMAVLTCRPVALPGIRRPRPSVYWPDDALTLAEALLASGR